MSKKKSRKKASKRRGGTHRLGKLAPKSKKSRKKAPARKKASAKQLEALSKAREARRGKAVSKKEINDVVNFMKSANKRGYGLAAHQLAMEAKEVAKYS